MNIINISTTHICRCLTKWWNSVPCGNKQCGWSEVGWGGKQLLQLITGSLEKAGIRCLPVENVSTSSNVHIIPEWSNQWNKVIRWKSLRYEFSKCKSKWNNSICVYLWTKSRERSKSVTVIIIITSKMFMSEATKIIYCIVIDNNQLVYVWSTHHE